jgi:hypothetical protein
MPKRALMLRRLYVLDMELVVCDCLQVQRENEGVPFGFDEVSNTRIVVGCIQD